MNAEQLLDAQQTLADKEGDLAGLKAQRDDLAQKIGLNDPAIDRLNLRIAICRDEIKLLAEQVPPQRGWAMRGSDSTHEAVRKLILEAKVPCEKSIRYHLDEIVRLADDFRLNVHRLFVERHFDYSDPQGEFQLHISHAGINQLLADPPASDAVQPPEDDGTDIDIWS
jgi:hypothetical protein